MPSSKPKTKAENAELAALEKLRRERAARTPAERAELEGQWLLENAEAIRLEHEYIEKHGPPLARYRQF